MNFFDKYFLNCYYYPKNIAERGVENNTVYSYVSSTFLNGFINYTKPFYVLLIERYRNWDKDGSFMKDNESKRKSIKEITELANKYHTDYNLIDDDVVILSETDNCYWIFWSDRDCSDCCIGRFDKDDIIKEELIKDLKETIVSLKSREPGKVEENTEGISGRYLELPLPEGWINF